MKKTISDYWESIFKDFDILEYLQEHDYFQITADQIRQYKEPRLMTKFDTKKSRPKIFKDNNLSILPINNGVYIIGFFELYEKLGVVFSEPETIVFDESMSTIEIDNVYSESNSLHIAKITGMLEQMAGEEVEQTISGRMRPSPFSFQIKNKNENSITINVDRPQIEIDGGYEGKSKLLLVEAKNIYNEDFIIRQLYYPFRYWFNRTKKEIVPLFLIYDNGIFSFFKYTFRDPENINSIELLEAKEFVLINKSEQKNKKEIFDEIIICNERPQTEVPFPQANSFNTVRKVIELISEHNTTAKIAEMMRFDPRQGNYYVSAVRYLGLVKKSASNTYELTPLGNDYIKATEKDRLIILFKQILEHEIFYLSFEYYLEYQEVPSLIKIQQFMNDTKTDISHKLNATTKRRRSSTVQSWIYWIIGTSSF